MKDDSFSQNFVKYYSIYISSVFEVTVHWARFQDSITHTGK